MTDDELRELGKRGLIIAPNETKAAFFLRVATSPQKHDPIPTPFGCAPDWLEVSCDDKGLSLWQGGAIWIENGKARIQLRKAFRHKERYLSYSKREILEHEAIHATRLGYDEPRFEEIFAYMSSPSKWRRICGPLFRTPLESTLFVLAAALAFPLQLFFPWLALLPFLALAFSGVRLYRDRRTLKRAIKTLSHRFSGDPLAIAFRLTDAEIATCAKGAIPADDSLRWRQIKIIS